MPFWGLQGATQIAPGPFAHHLFCKISLARLHVGLLCRGGWVKRALTKRNRGGAAAFVRDVLGCTMSFWFLLFLRCPWQAGRLQFQLPRALNEPEGLFTCRCTTRSLAYLFCSCSYCLLFLAFSLKCTPQAISQASPRRVSISFWFTNLS